MSSTVTHDIPNSGELYDVLIIGGSYAGLSAALTLYRALHRCAIFDSNAARNILSSKMRLTSGWEGQDPRELQEAARSELLASGLIDFIHRPALSARKTSEGIFEVMDETGKAWTGRKLLLSTGVRETYPSIEGYAEYYGKSIFNCMFCYGYEQQGSRKAGVLAVGVLGNPAHALTNANDAHKFVDSVTIFTNGNSGLMEELHNQLPEGIIVDNRLVSRLHQSQKSEGIYVEMESGERIHLAFLVHKPDLNVDSTFPEQLGLALVPGIGIKVSPPFNQTNVEGVFAAGDCCSPLRMIPHAMSMGSFAGCGIARELPKASRGPKPPTAVSTTQEGGGVLGVA